MKAMQLLKIITVLIGLMARSLAYAGPDYASDETRRVITAMVEAHGGIERWREAPSIRFDNVMHMNFAPKEQFAWWIAHEVIDQQTRKVWQDWPMDDARIGFDGESVWSTNWQRGNPSAFMVHFFYYFVNLPWITQDDGVVLSDVGRFDWPGVADDLYEIRMSFEVGTFGGQVRQGLFRSLRSIRKRTAWPGTSTATATSRFSK